MKIDLNLFIHLDLKEKKKKKSDNNLWNRTGVNKKK